MYWRRAGRQHAAEVRSAAIARHDAEVARQEAAAADPLLNRLGHLAYVLLVVGQVALALGVPAGFAVRVLGEVVWVYVGVRLGMSSVWAWCALFAAIDLVAFVARMAGLVSVSLAVSA